jgi:hypothetical protein
MTMGKTSYIWALLLLLTRMSWVVERPVTRQGFLDPTQSVGLKLSSQLLRLAKVIHGSQPVQE